MFLNRFTKKHAPELPRNTVWIQGKSLSKKELYSGPVLFDFWTYSCSNCVRNIAHIEKIHNTYKKYGLTVIGIHTPEYGFETEVTNVKKAIKELGISYPVILDAKYDLWKKFHNKYWPHRYLVDRHGIISYDHVGEGGYGETEHAIQALLQAGGEQQLPDIEPDESVGGTLCYPATPEVYFGFLRGKISNNQSEVPNEEVAFTAPEAHVQDIPALQGHFIVQKDAIEHSRSLPHFSEYVAIKYSGFSVRGIFSLSGRRRAQVEVELDGHPLPEDMAGSDVRIQKNGRALLTITADKLYNIVDADTYHKGVLKLKVKEDGLRLHALNFGACKGQ